MQDPKGIKDLIGTRSLAEWLGWLPRFESLVLGAAVPVYVRSSRGRRPVGSGVILALGDRRFLATAAHVADDLALGEPEFGLGAQLIPIRFPFITTNTSGAIRRADDELDTALAEISYIDLGESPCPGVPPRAFDITEGDFPEDIFLVTGFPASKQDVRAAPDGLTASLHRFGTRAAQRPGEGSGRRFFLDLAFNRRRLWVGGRQFTGPSLSGMSGGAVWRVDEEDRSLRLAGLLTRHSQPQKLARVTRLWFVLSAVWNVFPELRHALPEHTLS